jgi:HPt (histidine-containing phosphotransfer) domain-containing protein
VLDAAAVGELRALEAQGATGLVTKAIDLYLKDATRHLEAIQTAVAAGDAGALRERAHSLKGASANLGARDVAQLCKELEQMGASKVLDGANAAAARLSGAFAEARTALLRERDKETP